MNIDLIADGFTRWHRFRRQWGIAFRIGEDVIFDTFGDGRIFIRNLRALNISSYSINHVVISHDDWDHIAGLEPFLRENPLARVYVCRKAGHEIKRIVKDLYARLIEINEPRKIRDGLFTTGQMQVDVNGRTVYEQALYTVRNENAIVVTGCAHPGIISIIKYVRDLTGRPCSMVIGGFHLKDSPRDEIEKIAHDMIELGVRQVIPLPCTGARAAKIFQKYFKERCCGLKPAASYVI